MTTAPTGSTIAALPLASAAASSGNGVQASALAAASPVPKLAPLDERQWRELRRRFSDLDGYRPVPDGDPLGALESWVEPNRSATLYDQACAPILNVRRDEQRGLTGEVLQSRVVSGNRKVEHWDSVKLGYSVDLLCGSTIEWERTRDGRWEQGAVSATGCLEQGPQGLSKVTATMAWYGGDHYEFEMVLRVVWTEHQTCTDGTKRDCSTETYGFAAKPLSPSRRAAATARAKGEFSRPNVDCTEPCSKTNEPEVSAALDLLRGHAFESVRPEDQVHPVLFRSLKACKAYHAIARIPEPWSVHGGH